MTGIERHWLEENQKELVAKKKRLEELQAKIWNPEYFEMEQLRAELYPRFISTLQEQQMVVGSSVPFDLLGNLFGGIGRGIA